MNCCPMTPAPNPTIAFASPPIPTVPLESASCTIPAALPASIPATGPLVSATYTTTTSTRSSAAVPPTRKRARLVCNASARAIAMRTPAAFTRDPGPHPVRATLSPSGRRQDDQHRFERRKIDRRADHDRAVFA